MKSNQFLLSTYVVAILVLFLLPMSVPGVRIVGIGGDKWTHVALIGGLAILLRWKFVGSSHPALRSIVIATLLAAFVEVAQIFVAYRSADWRDLVAGIIGSLLGVSAMHHILRSPSPEKSVGTIAAALGTVIIACSLLADFGIRRSHHYHHQHQFGPYQIAGVLLGLLVVAGGVHLYRTRVRP